MILLCKECVCVHKICDENFGGCKKSFTWLDQKLNKIIDAYSLNADDCGQDLCPWPRDDAATRENIPTPFSILIEFEATAYSYSIRCSILIRNFKDIRFDIQFERHSRFVPSL